MKTLFYEDFDKGKVFKAGPRLVSEEEIINFANMWDPQYFHVNKNVAKESIYGGIIASGYHTCCIAMRMFCDEVLSKSASLGSPGINSIKWPNPVHANSKITLDIKVNKKRISKSNNTRGIIEWKHKAYNQNNNLVMEVLSIGIFKRRPK